jgi:probable addiction module antidote protein
MASAICDAFGGLSALTLPADSHQCLRRSSSCRDPKDRGRDHSHGLTEAKSRAEAPDGLGDIARAKGMTQIAHAAGLGRTNLYKALSPEGSPEFVTVASVLKALGLRLSIVI